MVNKKSARRNKVVVIGNGNVGLRFCQKLVELDQQQQFDLTVFSEEKLPAYDRRALATYGTHRNRDRILLTPLDWYQQHGIKLHLSDRVLKVDRSTRQVISCCGEVVDFDHVVLATGSYSFVPPIAGIEHPGVHLFRTVDDMDGIISAARDCRSVAVIGGGLFGLEAARAVHDLGLKTHIIESAAWLMQHQLDELGADCLKKSIENRGVDVHLGKVTTEILSEGDQIRGLEFRDGSQLPVDLVIFAAGIRPRDELGRISQLDIHHDGGIKVNNRLQTSDPSIFAIGKVAWHPDVQCGLVSPGCQMADVLAANLTGTPTEFTGIEQAVKRNLMGIDVACFGNEIFSEQDLESLTWRDPSRGIYRKLFINPQGTQLLGGILVGDTTDYEFLLDLMNSQQPLTGSLDQLLQNARERSQRLPKSAPASSTLKPGRTG